MEHFIIDAIGPFFHGYKKKSINWSKIPFENIETGGKLNWKRFRKILRLFETFSSKASSMGFNALSIDDVAHLADSTYYTKATKRKIADYIKAYREIFSITEKKRLKVFLNTDLMFFSKELDAVLKSDREIISFLADSVSQIFSEFSQPEGIIFRMGECDGVDVSGEFKSRLVIKTAGQLNAYIRALLPLFEKWGKYLVIRTWAAGAYSIGDIMWNRKTYDACFSGIKSPNLIVSMKYGETDFFRNVELNPLFDGDIKKIIELQAKREYDGMGELPYYTGWDYERFRKQLKNNKSVKGISVWCQTGGWSSRRRITFLENSSVWTELNTFSTLKIFKEGKSADKCLYEYLKNTKAKNFISKYNEVSGEVMYLTDKSLYFRRVRVPPLLWIYWDNVTVSSLIASFYSVFGKPCAAHENDITELYELGKEAKIDDLSFICDTLRAFYNCRMLLSGNDLGASRAVLNYGKRNRLYKFNIKKIKKSFLLSLMMMLMVRETPRYRWIDKILMSKPISLIIRKGLGLYSKSLPGFVDKQAMKLETLFL